MLKPSGSSIRVLCILFVVISSLLFIRICIYDRPRSLLCGASNWRFICPDILPKAAKTIPEPKNAILSPTLPSYYIPAFKFLKRIERERAVDVFVSSWPKQTHSQTILKNINDHVDVPYWICVFDNGWSERCRRNGCCWVVMDMMGYANTSWILPHYLVRTMGVSTENCALACINRSNIKINVTHTHTASPERIRTRADESIKLKHHFIRSQSWDHHGTVSQNLRWRSLQKKNLEGLIRM